MVGLAVKGNGTDAASDRSLEVLRSEVVPATVGALPNAEVAVSGMTAGSKDFVDTMRSHMPIVFLFVLSLAFILLLVTFRSIVVPIKAIVLNLLSVGAAYGLLTWLFQDGHGEQALGFNSVGGITPWLPLFLFVVLFGLSMDYHVFVLSRVREAVDRGMSTDDAVSHGIKSTAGVVTSAALVMVACSAPSRSLRPDDEAARRRPRRGDPDRRDDRPGDPAPGDHEAPRQRQLVPPEASEWLPSSSTSPAGRAYLKRHAR
jgi:RND superfamily putative drug exporter